MLDTLNTLTQKWRAVFYRPVLNLLDRLHITANGLTNFRLVAGLVFLAWFPYNPLPASILVLVVLILDTVDGSLARLQQRASDRGKFLDVLVDHAVYCFIVFSLLQFSLDKDLIIYNFFITPMAYLLAAIKKGESEPTDWIIKPYPRLAYLKVLVVVPFFLKVFFDIDWLTEGLIVGNILGTVMTIYYFIFIQLRWRTRENKKTRSSTNNE